MKLDNIDIEMNKMLKFQSEIFNKKIQSQAKLFANLACIKTVKTKESVFEAVKSIYKTEMSSLNESLELLNSVVIKI